MHRRPDPESPAAKSRARAASPHHGARLQSSRRVAVAGRARLDPDQELDGLWWDAPGPLTLVARQEDAVSELPGQTYVSLPRAISLAPQGDLYFLAGLAPAGGDSALDPDPLAGPAGWLPRARHAFGFESSRAQHL